MTILLLRKKSQASRVIHKMNGNGVPKVATEFDCGLRNGQVLQRLGSGGANVDIRFSSPDSGPVFATLSASQGVVRGWKKRRLPRKVRAGVSTVRLRGIPAGGPYQLVLRTGEGKISFKAAEFFVGDVWLLAGQSNMQGCGDMEGAAEPHPLVRVFSMRREWRVAAEPLHIREESPDACHNGGRQLTRPESEDQRRSTKRGTGVGLFFAREMCARSKVPQGLIATAHGGTSMAQWDPKRRREGGNSFYASMLASVKATGQPLAGVLWYQGESDSTPELAKVYTRNMIRLVAALRRQLHQTRLPWVVAQLCRFHSLRTEAQSEAWNSIQEQQRLLPERIRELETVSTIDLSLDDHVHIGSAGFPRLASRMAHAAERLISGKRNIKRPPQFQGLSLLPAVAGRPGALDVHFADVGGELRSGSQPAGFSLCNGNGRDLQSIFKITFRGSTVRLHVHPQPPLDGVLWYGRGTTPYCNIVDDRDCALPVLGPISLARECAILPFVTQWRVSAVVPSTLDLARLPSPDLDRLNTTVKSYPTDGFINEHAAWKGQSGQCYFETSMDLAEPMRLEFLMGYDGPFRLWLDRKPFFQNPAGFNPAFPDESRKSAKLSSGRHHIQVAMDLNHGRSWGFFLRFVRQDVTAAQRRSGRFAKPVILPIENIPCTNHSAAS